MKGLRAVIAAVAAVLALYAGMASAPSGVNEARGGSLSVSPGDTGWD